MPEEAQEPRPRVTPQPIEDELHRSYIDYAMSVIVGRALPDVRDGLKPVQRRILHAMNELGMGSGSQHKKAARVVGECLGKWHPHGDLAVYDALARMVQECSLRYPLIDGQGNWGSTEDEPAAMRYTECRLAKTAEAMLEDLEKDTVDWMDNFDGTLKEPTVLPSKFPNLIVNGSAGIAVGMATNIPPHNLREIVAATKRLIDDPELTTDDLCETVIGPDFPGGGVIYRFDEQRNVETGAAERVDAIRRAYAQGRGRIIARAKAHNEQLRGNRDAIIVTELPYAVNKASLIEKIADLVQNKKLAGISDIRDESDREGMRIVIEIKRDDDATLVLNNLYKHTAMQSAFNFNMLALVDQQPRTLSLKEILQHHIDHRRELIRRRTDDDYRETIKLISELESILASPRRILGLIKQDLDEIAAKYGDDRRTEIVDDTPRQLSAEELVADEDVVITVSSRNYVKRMPLSTYRAQHRGGRGVIGMATREEDDVEHLVVARSHDRLYVFTDRGRVFALKVFELPDASRTAKGTPIQNILEAMQAGERLTALVALRDTSSAEHLVMATRKGFIKKTPLSEYANVRRAGLIAIALRKG